MKQYIDFLGQHIEPSKIICIGRNYIQHAEELGNAIPTEPIIFLKPNSSITHELISYRDEPIHYECELCFLVEKNSITAAAVGLDLTKRTTQQYLKKHGLPWEKAKAFDGSALFSPFVKIDNYLVDGLSFHLYINGQLIQHGKIDAMLFQPEQLLVAIKACMSLIDGDVVMTGTPAGVGAVQPGDDFTVRLLRGQDILLSHSWLAQ